MRAGPSVLGLALAVLWSGSAAAFDCGKAATAVELAICANPELKRLDDRLETAYAEVKALSTKSERMMLGPAQKAWIAEREANCPRSGLGMDGCIKDMTATRLRMFEGRSESGPGVDDRIIPVFIVQDGTEEVYDLDISLLRFARPRTAGEKRFNAVEEGIARRIKLGPHGEDTAGHIYALEEALTVSYASPAFMSVMHSFWSDLGGAHGNGRLENVNIDMKTGKVLEISDMFPEPAVAKLTAQCKDKLIAEKRQRTDGEVYDPANDPFLVDEVIAEHVATMSRWSFTANEASVNFDTYAIGSHAEGSYDCTFAMTEVKAMALPKALLP